MAITAAFRADFTDFYTAVQKAEIALKSFEGDAGKVETALNKMTDSFSGRKIVQDAALMTRAVTEIGGATKLTEKEQLRLNATLTEAIEKYRVMGKQAPADMVALANATKKVDTELAKIPAKTTDIMGGLGKLAGAFGIAFSVGAVVNFGKSVFDSASQIGDLAKQLGISTAAVQGFKFAAEQSGSTLDAVGTAITKMNQHLSIGDASTVKALTAAGLKFSDIRNMKPEDAFLAIADAVQKIPDPMKQTEVALALFGRSAAELLPAIKEGFRGVSDGAAKMSDDTILSLKAAQDAWKALADKVTIVTGTIIAKGMEQLNFMAKMRAEADRLGISFSSGGGPTAPAAPAGLTSQGAKDITLTEQALDDLTKSLTVQRGVLDPHTQAVMALMKAYSGKAAIDAAKMAVEAVTAAARAGVPIQKMTADQQHAINKTMAASIEAYRAQGKVAPESIRLIYLATLDAIPVVKRLNEHLSALPRSLNDSIPLIDNFSRAWPTSIPGLDKMLDEIPRLGTETKEATKAATDHIGDLSRSFAELAQISGGTLGAMVGGLGQVVNSFDMAKKGMDRFNASIKTGDFAGVASGLMGIVSAGVMLGNIFNDLTSQGDKHSGGVLGLRTGWLGDAVGTNTTARGMVKTFAELHGGFEALHDEMLATIPDAERLWVILTQTIGNADEGAAIRAIQAIQDAISAAPATGASAAGYKTRAELQAIADKAKAVYEYMVTSGLYTASALADAFEASAAAQRDAMGDVGAASDAALDAIKALDDEIKSLNDSIANEAPEEVMGVIEAQTRAHIAAIQRERDEAQLALDETAGDAAAAAEDAAQAIEDTLAAHDFRVKIHFDLDELPGHLGFGAGSASTTPTIQTVVMLDGQVLAESMSHEVLG